MDVKNILILLSKKDLELDYIRIIYIRFILKVHFKIAITKIFFISAFINSVKDKNLF